MPTYEYRCRDCATSLEVVQKFSDDPVTVCPTCGGRLRKLFSAVGVVFKGSGFYKTDSRSKKTSSTGEPAPVTAQANGDKADSTTKTDGAKTTETAPSTASGASSDGGSTGKDATVKGSGAKDSGGRDSVGKDSGGRDSGGKNSGGKSTGKDSVHKVA